MKTPIRIATVIACLLCIATLSFASPVTAAELPAKSRAEINYLLDRLGNSDCQFYRNGSWHGAAQARDHLAQKFAYLANKNLLKSSEDFIDLGASKSSMSGKPYQVKCGNAKAVDSAVWLNAELARYRKQPPPR